MYPLLCCSIPYIVAALPLLSTAILEVSICCTLCTWCACTTISLSLQRFFSAQPPINMSFASTLLLHLLVFCTQTCRRYQECVIRSLSTTGSTKSVQNSLCNDTFFADNIFNLFPTNFNTAHAFPTTASHCEHISIYMLVLSSRTINGSPKLGYNSSHTSPTTTLTLLPPFSTEFTRF